MSETGYLEDCCFNYHRDNCPGASRCACRCHAEILVPPRPECGHEAEMERYRQRSRDEDTVRIRLNHARIELRDALSELISFAEEHVEMSYRDADVPQMLDDPILRRARKALRDQS